MDTGPARSYTVGACRTRVVDAATGRAFVTNEDAASVSVLDCDTAMSFGPEPHRLASSTSQTAPPVTIDAYRLEVFNLQTSELVATVPYETGMTRRSGFLALNWAGDVRVGPVTFAQDVRSSVSVLARACCDEGVEGVDRRGD